MQRMFNIDKWQLLNDGKSVNFGNTEQRRVKIDFNAPHPVAIYYADEDGNITFLAAVHGRDTVEFATPGAFSLTADGGEVWFDTVDGEDYSFAIPDAVVLTKIVNRRPRNPELERMQFLMNQNIEMRMEAQRRELEQLFSARSAAAPAPAKQPAGAPAGGADKPESEPAAGAAGKPSKPPAADAASAASASD